MADVAVPSIATATPAADDTVLGVQGGAVKRFSVSALPFTQAGTGAVARTVEAKLRDAVSVKDFGVVGDYVTDDSVAFRKFWEFLRNDWYDNGVTHHATISGNIRLASPAEDRAGLAVYVCDFPVTLEGDIGSRITVTGSTAACVFQIGTYATTAHHRSLRNLHVNGNGSAGGFVFADSFQGRLRASNLYATECTVGFKAVNLQEGFLYGLTAVACGVGLHVPVGNVSRASGSNGIYATEESTQSNNNNRFEVFIQNAATTGIQIDGGINNAFSGLVQGATPSGWMVDIAGGHSISLYDLYTEASGIPHRELRTQATFSGSLTLCNVYGATVGAQATILGGKLTWLQRPSWLGRIDVTAPGLVIYDHAGGTATTGPAQRLDSGKPVGSSDSTVSQTDGIPQNRQQFHKGVIAPGATFIFFSFGNSAVGGNETKGFRAYINIWEQGTTNMCSAEVFADGRAAYPTTRVAVSEKLGTLAGVSCALSVYKVGSSPYHLMRASLGNTGGVNSVQYEIQVYPFEF